MKTVCTPLLLLAFGLAQQALGLSPPGTEQHPLLLDLPNAGLSSAGIELPLQHISEPNSQAFLDKDDYDAPNFTECRDNSTRFSRICDATYGKIVSHQSLTGSQNYNFNMTDPKDPIQIMFWHNKTDKKPTECIMTIGEALVDPGNPNLHDMTFFYMLSNGTVVMYGKSGDNCKDVTVYYQAITPDVSEQTITEANLTGTIKFPKDSTNMSYFGYPPQHQLLYVFDYPEDYIVILNVSELNLGYRDADLMWGFNSNDYNMGTYYNYTMNDMLLFGIGKEALETTDTALFGYRSTPQTITINSNECHVAFYSSYHEQYATGFTIHFRANKVEPLTTASPISTTTEIVPRQALPSDWAALHGVDQTHDNLTEEFQEAMAEIATEYVKETNLDVAPPRKINSSEVIVYELRSCLAGAECAADPCLAFNFSIDKTTANRSDWAFSVQVLDNMLNDPDLQHYWSDTVDPKAEYCDEIVTINWWVYGGVGLVTVLFVAALSLIVWKVTKMQVVKESQETCEEDAKLEELEKRRRSSGDVSVIGGVKPRNKLSLPFAQDRDSLATVTSEKEEEVYDTEGFIDYDPDLGFDDHDMNSGLGTYSNAAYVPDSPTRQRRMRQLQQMQQAQQSKYETLVELSPSDNQVAGAFPLKSSMKKEREVQDVVKSAKFVDLEENTDSDDSDGAIQFQRSNLTPKKSEIRFREDDDEDMGESAL